MINEEIREEARRMLDDWNADHAEVEAQVSIEVRCERCGAEPGEQCRNIYRPALLVPPHFGRTAQ